MLIDHANSEKKVLSSAIHLAYRCISFDVMSAMSTIIGAENDHFQGLLQIIQSRHIEHVPISAFRSASRLKEKIEGNEEQKLLDLLVIGSFIQGQAHKRFAHSFRCLDHDLESFYESFIGVQEQYFNIYLSLAESIYRNNLVSSRKSCFAADELMS